MFRRIVLQDDDGDFAATRFLNQVKILEPRPCLSARLQSSAQPGSGREILRRFRAEGIRVAAVVRRLPELVAERDFHEILIGSPSERRFDVVVNVAYPASGKSFTYPRQSGALFDTVEGACSEIVRAPGRRGEQCRGCSLTAGDNVVGPIKPATEGRRDRRSRLNVTWRARSSSAARLELIGARVDRAAAPSLGAAGADSTLFTGGVVAFPGAWFGQCDITLTQFHIHEKCFLCCGVGPAELQSDITVDSKCVLCSQQRSSSWWSEGVRIGSCGDSCECHSQDMASCCMAHLRDKLPQCRAGHVPRFAVFCLSPWISLLEGMCCV